jgi:hypothetical protein
LDRLGAAYETDATPPNTDAADGGDAGPIYHDIRDETFWTTVNITEQYPLAHDFAGGAFDGHYVYFAPAQSGVVARYEVGKDFKDPDAWKVEDVLADFSAEGLLAEGFVGAVFDGRFVYFVPYMVLGQLNGLIVRFDTRLGFNDKGSWEAVDLGPQSTGRVGFAGGVFDGQYVYLVPLRAGHSNVTRFDTNSQAFDAGWTAVDLTAATDDQALGFAGGVFDGQYIYLVSSGNDSVHHYVARYDPKGDFYGGGWRTFDPQGLNPNAYDFFGGAFDGKYLYLSPNSAPSPNFVLQYDTTGAFNASWSTPFDTTLIDSDAKAFGGAAFDGRYVYFVPSGGGAAAKPIATRYDTTAPFSTVDSWSKFDMQPLDPPVKGFTGSVFDGRYLYLVPNSGGVVARFDARSPPSMPKLPAFYGSFL